MKIEHNKELKELNTFGLSSIASQFALYSSAEELREIFSTLTGRWIVIGGGSNMLFTKDFDGLVLKCNNTSICEVKRDKGKVFIEAGAGVVWDDLCIYALNNNLYNIENLAIIPGSVGASAVQNVGAYGAEAKDVIWSVKYFDTQSLETKTIMGCDCEFGYRDSIFKNSLKERAIILSVTYSFSEEKSFNLDYGNLKASVEKLGEPTLNSVRNAVIATREEKLPDPKKIGNGGSFFKNPVVDNNTFQHLLEEYPSMPHFQVDGGYKIPAAWLIDGCNWKGFRDGDAGVYEKQPLVLVNFGKATGKEIFSLATKIIESVSKKFSITLHPEINII